MVKFEVGTITQTAEDIMIARQLAYVAWLDTFRVPSELDQIEPPNELPDIEEFRSCVLDELTRRRGDARRKHITNAYGQQQVYTDKYFQAIRFLEERRLYPDPEDYPSLFGDEAKEYGDNPRQMADRILDAKKRWQAASDKIEGAVRKAQKVIVNAKTHDEMITILVELDI